MKLVRLIVAFLALGASSASAQTIISGTISSNGQCVTTAVGERPSFTIDVSGTFTGTITFQAASRSTTYRNYLMVNQTTGASASSTTSGGSFATTNLGIVSVRACATSSVTGTAVISIVRGIADGGTVSSSGGGGGGGAATVADGADVALGSTTDAAASGNGTVNAHLRQLVGQSSTENASIGATTDAAAGVDQNGSAIAQLRQAVVSLNAIVTALSGTLTTTASITNGSATDTNGATITAGQTGIADTNAFLYGYNGTANVRVGAKASTPASSDNGIITRPLVATDGTNSTPTMDAVGRAGFQKITDGTNTLPTMDAVGRAGFQRVTDGTNTVTIDPCESSGATVSYVAISQTSSAVVKAGTASKKTYVCGLMVAGADAENLSLVGGTGSACGTSTVALIGSTTAANGPNLAANGGFVLPVSKSSWTATTVNADDLCLLQSGSGRVAGVLKVAVQ